MSRIAEIEAELRHFVVRELLHGDDGHLTSTTPLLEGGLLDSIAIMNLVAFLEESYSIEVRSEYVTPQNLRTLESLAALVLRIEGARDER